MMFTKIKWLNWARAASMTWLFFICAITTVNAQDASVSGLVTDEETGEPIPGVTILVKGQSAGTVSDIDGKYSISVPSDGILIFSFIGYQTIEQPVGGRSTIDVLLPVDIQSLEEVVVIGYGTQRREAVTGSVVSIQSDQITEVPSANVSQALQGRLAGVSITPSSSKPGADMQIRIRGTRSLNASNDPLIVLDGIPFAGTLGDINPNTIKSVDILKDASSTAIYGSRGANGVILITTTTGTKGQPAQLTYSTFYGIKKEFGAYPMMNGPDFVELRTTAGQYSNSADEDDNVNTDWQSLLYGKAVTKNHDIGITGGTEGGSYSFGVGYYYDEAILPGQDYTRYSLRASIDQEIGEYFRVGFTSNSNYAINQGNNLDIYDVLSASPIASPYDANGDLKRVIEMPLDPFWVKTRESVNALGDSWIDETKSLGTYNSIYGIFDIPGIEGLSYRLNLGLNYRQSSTGQFTGEGVFNTNASNPSSAVVENSLTTSWTVENILSYDKTFADKHNINLVALYSAQEDFYNKSRVTNMGIANEAFQYFNLGHSAEQPIVDPDDQDYWVSGLTSAMGRLQYDYDGRYMIQASYRWDGSSRLAEGNKWVSYPAISAGWNVHRESFLSGVDVISRLKVRGGYGITSNQAIDPYSTLGRLGTRPYNFGSDFTTGYYVTSLPNPGLGWEISKTTNIAVEFGVLENRLSGTFEYYSTKTEDLLFTVGLPKTSGVDSFVGNIGSSENKGFELTLNALILDNPNGLTWEAGFNIYANRNKLTGLASGQDRDEGNWWFVGHPIDVIYDYQNIGNWQEEDQYRDILEPDGNVGMIKVLYTGEYDNTGVPVRAINAEDRQIISMQPDFEGGFDTRLSFKGLDLTIVGVYKKGGKLIATQYGSRGYLNILSGRRGNIDVDYWTPETPDNRFPAPGGVGADSPKYLNTLSYFDGSFLKVRAMTLGYNFVQAQKWLDKAGIANLRVYATLQNPFVLFSPYHDQSGMDPETNSRADQNAAVPLADPNNPNDRRDRILVIGTNTPTTRNFVFGLNLTF